MILKKLSAILMSAALAVTMCGCNNGSTSGNSRTDTPSSVQSSDTESTPNNVSAGTGSFKVDGTKLLDANGNEFVMRGINHAHTWFRDNLDDALNGIAKTGANCVRIVLSDGDQWEKIPADEFETVVNKCLEHKMVVIAELHDGTGKEEIGYIDNAVEYWIEMKDILNAHTDTVILNIANEWVGKWDSDNWKKGYTSAIPKLREAGIKNTIMVDAAGWGQYGESIKQAGKAVFDSDPDKNTIFSIHMYGSAGKNAKTIKSNLTGVTDQDLCVVVGEFGYTHSDGDVNEVYIMKYCTENNIGYIGWSWKGNGGGVEYLDLAKDWLGEQLSEDWGEVLINGENGIKATAKVCTVFE